MASFSYLSYFLFIRGWLSSFYNQTCKQLRVLQATKHITFKWCFKHTPLNYFFLLRFLNLVLTYDYKPKNPKKRNFKLLFQKNKKQENTSDFNFYEHSFRWFLIFSRINLRGLVKLGCGRINIFKFFLQCMSTYTSEFEPNF